MKGKVNMFRILSVFEGDIANSDKGLSEISSYPFTNQIVKTNKIGTNITLIICDKFFVILAYFLTIKL
jgi:hypothetical protein